MPSDFEFIKHVIDKTDMSDDDKTFLKTSLWTSEEIPEITTAKQYEAYNGSLRDARYQSDEP